MEIRNNISNRQPSFGAKFLHTEDLKQIVDYAVAHNKFDKLNTSRKNIDTSYLKVRLKVELKVNEKGIPTIRFTRFVPKRNIIARTFDDYEAVKVVEYWPAKRIHPLKFALRKIIELGNNAPHNKMYQKVVAKFD